MASEDIISSRLDRTLPEETNEPPETAVAPGTNDSDASTGWLSGFDKRLIAAVVGLLVSVAVIIPMALTISSEDSSVEDAFEEPIMVGETASAISNVPSISQPSERPTSRPTWKPTEDPTLVPTGTPEEPTIGTIALSQSPTAEKAMTVITQMIFTSSPSVQPTDTSQPSFGPTNTPTNRPTNKPTDRPTNRPTNRPTPQNRPTNRPTPPTNDLTFVPGLLTVQEQGLSLSQGLTAQIIATTGQPVQYYSPTTGMFTKSSQIFHSQPDAGAVFDDPNGNGWIYVSNSEVENKKGGVGALTFDDQGRIIDYKRLLTGTTMNCGGGRTAWNTWVSCEEHARKGVLYQVDPTGQRAPQQLTLGSEGGSWESFAYDVRNRNAPQFFVTEDLEDGALQRFRPSNVNWSSDSTAWNMLHGAGVTEYLFLHPTKGGDFSSGVFSWGRNRAAARQNAELYYTKSEGIDVHDNTLYFISKWLKMMFELNLDTMQYTRHSTRAGLFNGQPDQLKRILSEGGEEFLFFTEEGGPAAGIHGRDESGLFFTILESSVYADETTGLAFSPNYMHMYIAYQDNGLLFDVSRKDGEPFHARRLDVKYHAV